MSGLTLSGGPITGSGTITLGGGGIAAVKNIKDYGAVGDGITDSTAAIQSAITAAGIYGTVWIPSGNYLVSSNLTVTRPIRIFGENLGSVLYVSAAFPTNQNVINFVATNQFETLVLEHFSILPVSGTPAQHGLYFNVTNTSGGWSDVTIRNLFIRMKNGAAIYVNNSGKDHDGFFTSRILDNVLGGGFQGYGIGDSIQICRNVLTTPSGATTNAYHGITFSQVMASDPVGVEAHGILIADNNFTAPGGIRVLAGSHIRIQNNNIEFGSLESQTPEKAAIALVGDATHSIYNPIISGNYIGPATHLSDRNIYINYATSTEVRGNIMMPAGGLVVGGVTNNWSGIYIDTGAFKTLLGQNNWPYPIWYGWEAKMVNNAGTHTTRETTEESILNVPFGATIDYIDPDTAKTFRITATSGIAFTINNPKVLGWLSGMGYGWPLEIQIVNNSGGNLGTVTWGALYDATGFVAPKNGDAAFLKFVFDIDGKWRLLSQSYRGHTTLASEFQAYDLDLQRIAAVSWSLGDFPWHDGTGLTNLSTTAAGRSLLTAADAAAQRTALGIATNLYQPANSALSNLAAATAGNSSNFWSGTNGFRQVTTNDIPGLVAALAAGGGGGGSVSINGTTVSSPNFSNSVPAAPTNGVNVAWQSSGANVSGYVYPLRTLKSWTALDNMPTTNASSVALFKVRGNGIPALAFNQTAQTEAQFMFKTPVSGWNPTVGLTAEIEWYSEAALVNSNVVWQAKLLALSQSSLDVTNALLTATATNHPPASAGTLTNSVFTLGTNLIPNRTYILQIARLPGDAADDDTTNACLVSGSIWTTQ